MWKSPDPASENSSKITDTIAGLPDGNYVAGIYCVSDGPTPAGYNQTHNLVELPFTLPQAPAKPGGGFGSIQFPAFGSKKLTTKPPTSQGGWGLSSSAEGLFLLAAEDVAE